MHKKKKKEKKRKHKPEPWTAKVALRLAGVLLVGFLPFHMDGRNVKAASLGCDRRSASDSVVGRDR